MRNGSIINTMIPDSSYRIVLNQETLRDDGYTFRSYDAVGRETTKVSHMTIIEYHHL